MRILWSSNAPWAPSGYGVQTALATPRIKAAGHEVAILAWYGQECCVGEWNGIPIYPRFGHPYGIDVQPHHYRNFRADVLITHIDAWVQEPEAMLREGVCWAPWFPVDTEPMAPIVREKIKLAFERLVFSHTAGEECKRAGLSAVYIPHAVDTSVYKPGDRDALRERMKIPAERFLVTILAANKGTPARKSWPEMIEAFSAFLKVCPNAHLYLHTVMDCSNGGEDIGQLLAANRVPTDRISVIDQYALRCGVPPNIVADALRASDVLLNPARGEGCGVPILEAQACGTPVVVGDWTAMTEHCYSGWTIPRADAERVWYSGQHSWQYVPHVRGIVKQLQNAYKALSQSSRRDAIRAKARQAILNHHDADTVARDYWVPALAELEKRIQRKDALLERLKGAVAA